MHAECLRFLKYSCRKFIAVTLDAMPHTLKMPALFHMKKKFNHKKQTRHAIHLSSHVSVNTGHILVVRPLQILSADKVLDTMLDQGHVRLKPTGKLLQNFTHELRVAELLARPANSYE
jgi:hypothetical protein